MDRTTFKDPRRQTAFERDGYVVVPLVEPEGVRELERLFRRLHPHQPEGFFATQFSGDRQYKAEVDREIRELEAGVVDAYLDGYRPLVGNFVVKAPGPASEMTTHQDWSFVDERRFASVNVWCPLVDVDRHNGALCVVAGSHRVLYTLRGTQLPSPTMAMDLDYDALTCLRLRAGEAVIYDHRLIHGSPPNRGSAPRVATALNWLPAEAPALHYRKHPDTGAVEVYEISPGFFAEFTYGDRELPPGSRLVDTIGDYSCPRFTESMLRGAGLLGGKASQGPSSAE